MRVKKIIKHFFFEENNRSKITLGPGIRLNPNEDGLQIVDVDGYSTGPNLYAKTWIFNPKKMVRFIGFASYADHYKNSNGDYVTSLNFRLGDGTNEYFWNGVNWEINTIDWNTEEEISENIASFPTTEKKLQVVINLVTTDSRYTPSLKDIRILYESVIDLQGDIIYKSVVPELRTINPIADYIIRLNSATDTIDLNDYPLKAPYNVVDVDSCFNYTDDPEQSTDIFSSYNPTTKTITLSEVVDSGKRIFVRFVYRPSVAVSTDQEYIEVSKVPAIRIISVDIVSDNVIQQNDSVINRSVGDGAVAIRARQRSIEFTASCLTSSALDQQRLQDEIRKYFVENKLIKIRGLDEEYSIRLTGDFVFSTSKTDLSNYSGTFRFAVYDVVYLQVVDSAFTVSTFNLEGDMNVTIT